MALPVFMNKHEVKCRVYVGPT